MAPAVRVAVALGSNLGDRKSHLDAACAELRGRLLDVRASRYRETEPVGIVDQPFFLNAAVVGTTSVLPRDFLLDLLDIEQRHGRGRPHPVGPRTLDLDLILYGDAIVTELGLLVPHPRFRARRFVLEPLAEIAPDLIDPVTRLTMAELLAQLTADG